MTRSRSLRRSRRERAEKHVAQLKRIAVDVKDGGMCKKGKDHADILAAFLVTMQRTSTRHVKGICTTMNARPSLPMR